MEDKQSRLPKFKRPADGRDPRFTTRIGLLWLIIVVIVIGVVFKAKQLQQEKVEELTYGQLEEKVEQGFIHKVVIEAGSGLLDKVKGEYEILDPRTSEKKPVKFAARVKICDEEKKLFS